MAQKTTPGVWASVPIETEPRKYDLGVLLALSPIRVYESIILSGTAGSEYGRLPWLALSVLGGHTSNAASEGLPFPGRVDCAAYLVGLADFQG